MGLTSRESDPPFDLSCAVDLPAVILRVAVRKHGNEKGEEEGAGAEGKEEPKHEARMRKKKDGRRKIASKHFPSENFLPVLEFFVTLEEFLWFPRKFKEFSFHGKDFYMTRMGTLYCE